MLGRISSLRTSAEQPLRHAEPRLLGRELDDGGLVEDLAFDRAALDHRPFVVAEPVEARLKQRLNRRRDGRRGAALLVDHRDHLLDEQRVPVGGREDPAADLAVERRAVEQVVEELVDVARRKRLEQDRRCVRLAAAPHRPGVEQLGTRDAQEEDRPVARPVRDDARARSSSVCSAQWMSSMTTNERPLRGARCSSSLPD